MDVSREELVYSSYSESEEEEEEGGRGGLRSAVVVQVSRVMLNAHVIKCTCMYLQNRGGLIRRLSHSPPTRCA